MQLRTWQSKAFDKVINEIKENKIVALQSPTGSGKTLFALFVGFKEFKKILFVVRTHNQFYPVYKEILNNFPDKSFSFLTGKPVSCVYADKTVEPEDINCKFCNIFTAIQVKVDRPPFQFLDSLKELGAEEGFCPYHSLHLSAEKSDVLTITYPYLFLPPLRETLDIDLEEYFIVIDEAHNLDSLSDYDERTLSEQTLVSAMSQSSSTSVNKILEKLRLFVKKNVNPNDKYVEVKNLLRLDEDEEELVEDEYIKLRDKMILDRKIRKNYIGSVIKFVKSLKEENVKLFSISGKLVIKKLDISKYLEILEKSNLAILMMSGTLPPPEYISKVWGIKREISYIDVESEFGLKGWGRKNFLLAKDVTTSYSFRSEIMWRKYASYLMRIYYSSINNVLAVTPSYETLQKISTLLENNISVIVENKDTTIEDIEKAIKRGKTLIMGVARGKFSEGIEFTENRRSLITDIAIVGIPYPSTDDFAKAKIETISKRVNGDVRELLFSIPALVAVRQIIGRAIRNEFDSPNIWLLDKRFDSEWWKNKLGAFNAKKIRL
ncbi:DEAD/DEAH box helicase [Sulfolobales archaeon HS-7]|nr:DEAD/DEAH box helicase [Sulfolobales archaeon HS-7]